MLASEYSIILELETEICLGTVYWMVDCATLTGHYNASTSPLCVPLTLHNVRLRQRHAICYCKNKSDQALLTQ